MKGLRLPLVALVVVLGCCGGFYQPMSMADPSFRAPTTYYDLTEDSDDAALPALTDTGLVRLCHVSSSAWVCEGPSGASTTVTAGTSTTFEATPFGALQAMGELTDAKTPSVSNANASALRLYSADHTILLVGWSSTRTTSSAQAGLDDESTGAGIEFRNESGGFKCKWSGTGSPTSITVQSQSSSRWTQGWTFQACRKSGNTYSSIANGNETTGDGTGLTVANPTGTVRFGRGFNTGIPLRGPLLAVAYFNVALTDAQIAAYMEKLTGQTRRTGATSPTSGGNSTFIPAGTSTAYVTSSGMWRNGPDGQLNERAVTVRWAPTLTTLSGASDVGTPTITADTAAGPFDNWLGGNTCDLMVDDDAAAFEGKRSTTSIHKNTGNTEKYTASFWLRTGTSGTTTDKATIRWTVAGDTVDSTACTGGTLSGSDCQYTLTSTPVRVWSTITVASDTMTSVKADLYVGTATSDTGSIIVCHGQQEPQGWPSSEKLVEGAFGQDQLTVPAAETVSWPASAGGEFESIFTPNAAWTADQANSGDSIFPVDTRQDASSRGCYLLLQLATGKMETGCRQTKQRAAQSITSIDHGGAGNKVRVTTSVDHNLQVGRFVDITGTTNYNCAPCTVDSINSRTQATLTATSAAATETSGTLQARSNVANGVGLTDIRSTSAVTLLAGTQYVMRSRWAPCTPTSKTITSVDDSGTNGKLVVVTSAAHNLFVGRYFTVSGTTNYNGTYEVESVDSTTQVTTAETSGGTQPAETSGKMQAQGHCAYLYLDTCTNPLTCHAVTSVGSQTDGELEDISVLTHDQACLGRREDNSFHMDGRYARFVMRGL